ncbi:MAG: efflux RND transporter permease subunit, partial [Caldilineaceae bacterium]|nr:efflux RND transporter permease subunit [Caldilineaceae bacterium]
DGFQEREELTRLNGEESVTVAIRKQSGSNTLAIADGVKETLDAISQANPDLAIVIGGDESVVVRESTNGAISDLLWGALLAAFTILIFFRNFRNTFLTVVGMPLIVISSLFFMELAGISLNNVS